MKHSKPNWQRSWMPHEQQTNDGVACHPCHPAVAWVQWYHAGKMDCAALVLRATNQDVCQQEVVSKLQKCVAHRVSAWRNEFSGGASLSRAKCRRGLAGSLAPAMRATALSAACRPRPLGWAKRSIPRRCGIGAGRRLRRPGPGASSAGAGWAGHGVPDEASGPGRGPRRRTRRRHPPASRSD